MMQLSAELRAHWAPIAPILSLRNEQEFAAAVGRLNALVDDVGTDETHPLYGLLDTLGTLVHAYEEQHEKVPDVAGSAALAYLMEEHGLTSGDLLEIGDRAAVENYLTGQQELSVKQVRVLAQRFHVSPEVFIE